MHLSPHSLHQIDDAYLQSLEVEALRGLSMRLLADLKEAWDRLNQGPDNSSRPPSSRAPWERKGSTPESDEAPEDHELDLEPAETQPAETQPAEAQPWRRDRWRRNRWRRNRFANQANNGERPESAGPRCSRRTRSARTIPRSAPAVAGRWNGSGRWPTPGFRRWTCAGTIRRGRG